jgi:hypothetical protein
MRLYVFFFETSFFGGVPTRDIWTELAELIEHGTACMWGLEVEIQGRVDEAGPLRLDHPSFCMWIGAMYKVIMPQQFGFGTSNAVAQSVAGEWIA